MKKPGPNYYHIKDNVLYKAQPSIALNIFTKSILFFLLRFTKNLKKYTSVPLLTTPGVGSYDLV